MLGLYVVFKKKSDSLPQPQTQTTSQPVGETPTTPLANNQMSATAEQPPVPGSTPASASLESRLLGSRAARQIFNIQAVAYQTGFSDARPDGVWGPITQGIVNRAEDALYLRHTSGLVPDTLQRVRIAGQNLGRPARRLPMALSARVVTALMNDAAIADYQAIPIQGAVA